MFATEIFSIIKQETKTQISFDNVMALWSVVNTRYFPSNECLLLCVRKRMTMKRKTWRRLLLKYSERKMLISIR